MKDIIEIGKDIRRAARMARYEKGTATYEDILNYGGGRLDGIPRRIVAEQAELEGWASCPDEKSD